MVTDQQCAGTRPSEGVVDQTNDTQASELRSRSLLFRTSTATPGRYLPVYYLPSPLLCHHGQQGVPQVFPDQLVVQDLILELDQTQVIHIGSLTLVHIHTVLKGGGEKEIS